MNFRRAVLTVLGSLGPVLLIGACGDEKPAPMSAAADAADFPDVRAGNDGSTDTSVGAPDVSTLDDGASTADGPEDAGAVDGDAAMAVDAADDVVPDASIDAPNDAGIDAAGDAGPLPCSRAAQAKTAPAALYDAFVADMAGLVGAARTARVDAFLAAVDAQGGTPLEDPMTGRAVFLVRGAPPSGPWSVVGSFVAWDKNQGLAMTNVQGTDLFVADSNAIAPGTTHGYKLLSGSNDGGYRQDQLAKNVAWDGVYRPGATTFNVGQFNALIHPSAIPMTQGRLVVHGKVRATLLNNDRRVFTYLPASYDDGTCKALPSILFGDGNEALTRGDYATVANQLYQATPELSAVLVFAELASANVQQRVDEYTFGGGTAKGLQYVDFLQNDLWPSVAMRYRVCGKQEARGVAGVSLSGLIATFAAFEKPASFGWVGAQSPSYWWAGNGIVTRAQNTNPKIPVRFYMDSSSTCTNGGANLDNCDVVDAMANVMVAKGYDHQRVKTAVAAPDPHDWPYFKARAATMLTHFRQNQVICD